MPGPVPRWVCRTDPSTLEKDRAFRVKRDLREEFREGNCPILVLIQLCNHFLRDYSQVDILGFWYKSSILEGKRTSLRNSEKEIAHHLLRSKLRHWTKGCRPELCATGEPRAARRFYSHSFPGDWTTSYLHAGWRPTLRHVNDLLEEFREGNCAVLVRVQLTHHLLRGPLRLFQHERDELP